MPTIECEICLLEYNEETLTPRILTSCGHTICQQCAIRLSDANSRITCPFDRTVTQLDRNEGVYGLLKNFALLSLWRKEKQEEEKNSGKKADVPCFENPSHEAVLYCQQCEVDLCESCFTSVHKPKSLSAHQKINISEKPIKLPKYPKHPHNTAEFLCTDPKCTDSTNKQVFWKKLPGETSMEKLPKNKAPLRNLQLLSEQLGREKKGCLLVGGIKVESFEIPHGFFKELMKTL